MDREQERIKMERRKMVVCMEYIARQINDEEVFEGWLMCGVADGDIPYGCLDVGTDYIDDYIGDETFKDIMSCFLRRMVGAWNSGGLYCGDIVSEDKSDMEEVDNDG